MNANDKKAESEIYCLDCKRYFENMELFNEEHSKILYKNIIILLKTKHFNILDNL